MQVKFNTNSWHSRFYKRAYLKENHNLPRNLCPYFWKVVFALVFLPVTWWTYFCEKKLEIWYHVHRVLAGIVALVFILWIEWTGWSLATTAFNQGGAWAFIWGFPIGIIFSAAIFSLIFLLVRIFEKIQTWQYNRRYGEPRKKEPSLVASFIKAKKEKICPAIVWDGKEN